MMADLRASLGRYLGSAEERGRRNGAHASEYGAAGCRKANSRYKLKQNHMACAGDVHSQTAHELILPARKRHSKRYHRCAPPTRLALTVWGLLRAIFRAGGGGVGMGVGWLVGAVQMRRSEPLSARQRTTAWPMRDFEPASTSANRARSAAQARDCTCVRREGAARGRRVHTSPGCSRPLARSPVLFASLHGCFPHTMLTGTAALVRSSDLLPSFPSLPLPAYIRLLHVGEWME